MHLVNFEAFEILDVNIFDRAEWPYVREEMDCMPKNLLALSGNRRPSK